MPSSSDQPEPFPSQRGGPGEPGQPGQPDPDTARGAADAPEGPEPQATVAAEAAAGADGADSTDGADEAGPADGIHESKGAYESDDGIYDADPLDSSGGHRRLSRLNMGLLCLSVVSLSAALYISPAGSDVRDKVESTLPGTTIGKALGVPEATTSATPSPKPTTPTSPVLGVDSKSGTTIKGSPSASPSGLPGSGTGSTPSPGGSSGTSALAGRYDGGSFGNVAALSPSGTGSRPTGSASGSGGQGTHSTPAPTPTPPRPSTAADDQRTKCYQFTWQQDAQVVYVRNLSDPYGLDADPGPHDGDGLACSELPVDPSRPASRPVAAYSAPKPSVATKRDLLTPDKDYFGFMQDGVPGDGAAMEGLARRAGKAPSTTGWFASFDTPYRADLVRRSWEHGALPVITWMPVDEGSGTSYSLSTIIDGTHDRYLRRFAGDVVREGLPVSLRFGHEMNGSWYGWSAGRSDYNNTPAKYVAAWRHIWEVFDDVGATDEVIWLWSPGRVDNLTPSATNGLTSLADDYPGDAYVDWVGASVYLRHASVGPSYAASFGRTVAALEAVTDKPLFFGETAAMQTDLGVDRTSLKAEWIGNVLRQFANDDQVVGFLWFNNVAATVVNGVEVTNDWRFDASKPTRDAFRRVVDTPAFAEGVPLD